MWKCWSFILKCLYLSALLLLLRLVSNCILYAHVVSGSKTLYPYCLVLVGSRNGFERDFTIKLN